jgi:hypothetical protein
MGYNYCPYVLGRVIIHHMLYAMHIQQYLEIAVKFGLAFPVLLRVDNLAARKLMLNSGI